MTSLLDDRGARARWSALWSQAATELSNQPLLRAWPRSSRRRWPRSPASISPRRAGGQRATPSKRALQRAGLGGTDIVLRWLASYLLTPAGSEAITEDVQILLAGLPVGLGRGRAGSAPAAADGPRPA